MLKYIILILCVFAIIFFASAYYSLILKRGVTFFGPVIITGFRRMYKKFLNADEKISGTTRKIMTEKEKQKLDEEYRYKSADLSNPDTYKTVSTRMAGMIIAVFAINFKSVYGKILIAFFVVEMVFDIIEEYRYKSADLSNPDTYKTVSTRMAGMIIAVFAINFKSVYGKILIAFFVVEMVFDIIDFFISKHSGEKKQKLKSYEELKIWDRIFYGFIPQAIISILLVLVVF